MKPLTVSVQKGNCRKSAPHRTASRGKETCALILKRNMHKTIWIVGALMTVLSIVVASGSAQNQRPKPPVPTATPDPSQAEVINIRRVRLPITVTDKKGQFVSGLSANDFLVLEDKVPQKIDSFTSEENNNLPLYVAVLMDTSPSTSGKIKFVQESAMNFIQTVVRPRRAPGAAATVHHE